jgi:predicted DNA-binding protein YlxM (UPF0122 family)
MRISKQAATERRRVINRLLSEGKTLREISEQIGISRQRVYQINRINASKLEDFGEAASNTIGTRLYRVLKANGITDRDQAIQAYKDGKLRPQCKSGIGLKAFAELQAWLGDDLRCSHCGGGY